ncbi:MAG TPA: cytochrome c biogenesis protein ResB, partial [Candidatus Eisenbacteria bacterium]
TVLSTYFRAWIVFIPVQIFLPRQWDVPGVIPYPGGFTLGWMLFLNLVTAHAVRFKWQWKRAGLILIHLGLLLLIVGEFVTAISAEENRMTIVEGGTVNYATDIREVELAVVDRSAPDVDQVVAIPGHRLAHDQVIRDPRLPFDVRVEAYYQNAELVEGVDRAGGAGQADMGYAASRAITLRPVPPASGTDRDRSDLPAAMVTLEKDGKRLGTWIVSLYLTLTDVPPQPVTVDGRTVDMALRFKRVYKPYSMSLIDFRHDTYPGTETPMNYSSDVRLVDAAHGEDRQVRIYMNNPLRYRGETFYQSSFLEGDTGTVLQVVRNPGWLLPYLACAIGAFGLMLHFGTRLMAFLRRRSAA